jgi:hypothetical protein
LCAAIIFPYVQDYADNPDTFQYLEIAQKYLSGDWKNVVNGYWSPMISWLLLLPLSVLKVDLLAFKILQLLIGAFALSQWHRLLKNFPLDERWKRLLIFFPIPFLLDYALLNATPDLLFLGLALMLINRIIEGRIFSVRKSAITTAIIGAALYFTKAFGLPFFLLLMIIFFVIELKNQNNKGIIYKNAGILFFTFLILAFFWILPLSLQYKKFTISEAARFNMSREAAPLTERGPGLPILSEGLFIPLNNNLSAWETPGEYLSQGIITPFNSPGDYFSIVKRNILSIYYYDFRNQTGVFFLALFFLFLFRKGFRELIKEKYVAVLLVFIFLLYGGYALILVHSRYVWINTWLMFLLSVYFIQQSINLQKWKTTASILFYFMFALAIKRPCKEIFFTSDRQQPVQWIFHALKQPFTTLWVFYKPDLQLKQDIEAIKLAGILKGNLASLKTNSSERDPYTKALRVARENKCRFFGQPDDALTNLEQLLELQKMKIDYLLAWNYKEWGSDLPVYFNPETGVRIYKIE